MSRRSSRTAEAQLSQILDGSASLVYALERRLLLLKAACSSEEFQVGDVDRDFRDAIEDAATRSHKDIRALRLQLESVGKAIEIEAGAAR